MKRKLHLLGVQHKKQFLSDNNSQAVKQAVKVVFWQQKIEKDKMHAKEAKEEKESTTQLTLLILIYPRINK